MNKRARLDQQTLIRHGPATRANLEIIIEAGLASQDPGAFRTAVAIVARLLADDPHIYMVLIADRPSENRIFSTPAAARAWVEAQEDEDSIYEIVPVVPK